MDQGHQKLERYPSCAAEGSDEALVDDGAARWLSDYLHRRDAVHSQNGAVERVDFAEAKHVHRLGPDQGTVRLVVGRHFQGAWPRALQAVAQVIQYPKIQGIPEGAARAQQQR